MASTQEKSSVQQKSGQEIDPHEEPSAEWGWHGSFPMGRQIAGWFSVFALVMMTLTNHSGLLRGGHQLSSAEIWMICISVAMAGGLLYDLHRQRTAWRS